MFKNSLKIGEFVSIYTDVEDNSFSLGRILTVSEGEVIIASVDPMGNEDGLALYSLNAITKIEIDSRYAIKIQKLMNSRKTILRDYIFKQENLLLELLNLSKGNNKLIEIELQNSNLNGPIGVVEYIDERICEIKQFDEYGVADGVCIVLIEDISSVKYDNIELQAILLLSDI
jgi:hypothetical protein